MQSQCPKVKKKKKKGFCDIPAGQHCHLPADIPAPTNQGTGSSSGQIPHSHTTVLSPLEQLTSGEQSEHKRCQPRCPVHERKMAPAATVDMVPLRLGGDDVPQAAPKGSQGLPQTPQHHVLLIPQTALHQSHP